MQTEILIVEDDAATTEMLSIALETIYGFKTSCANTIAAGKSRLSDHPVIECILLDLHLSNGMGLDVIRGFQDSYPGIPIIVITGYPYNYTEVIEAGAHDFFQKPCDTKDLVETILHAIARHRVRGIFKPIHDVVDTLKDVMVRAAVRADCADNSQQALVQQIVTPRSAP